MGHALGLALQGRLNDAVSLALIIVRFAPATGSDLPDLPDALLVHPLARSTGTVGVSTGNASTSGAALPDYPESGGGSAECGHRRGARREPADRAAVAQAGARAGHRGGLGDRSRSRAQSAL